jgi:hypothetical protein
MRAFREIVIGPSIILPALTTDIPERPYSFLQFLSEWVISAREMRKDQNLTHLFEWDEAIEALSRRMAAKAGITEPILPSAPAAPAADANPAELQAYTATLQAISFAHNEAVAAYAKALSTAAQGEILYVSDAAFLVARAATKDALDAAMVPAQNGATALHRSYEPRVLRHYFWLIQSRAVDESDIPTRQR